MTSRAPIAEPIQMPAHSSAEAKWLGQETGHSGAGGVRVVSELSPAATNRRRAMAALLAVAWCAILGWLALATSNPVTLNRTQVRGADAVITARIENLAAGRCRVVQQWTGDALPDEVVVQGLDETAARGDGQWILPLERTREGYEVRPSALPSGARLVYPATEEAVGQLREMVE
jgi:hypothetical protein